MNSDAVGRGLAYLARQQLAKGNFASCSSSTLKPFEGRTYQTTFVSSCIGLALAAVDGAEHVRLRIGIYLQSQKSAAWSFNYWDRAASETESMPYPDDLDDTFCALALLHQTQPDTFSGIALGKIMQLLVANEVKVGGPYRTWLVADTMPEVWTDTDVAVNANIGYFLSRQNVRLPNLVTYIETAIRTEQVRSPYYPSVYPLAYFISRWYDGEEKGKLIDTICTKRRQGIWGNPLDTALAVSTLLRLGYPPLRLRRAMTYLQACQAADGSWPAAAFCIDPAIAGVTHYAGAKSLTTALCLEAISLYRQILGVQMVDEVPAASQPTSDYLVVTNNVRASIATLPRPELRRATESILQTIISKDNGPQIVLLPWHIARAVAMAEDESLLQQLAAANLWGWMAYTTYDDVLDQEADGHLLPGANVCLRKLEHTLAKILPDVPAFQTEVGHIMDRLDAANAWEVACCRFTVDGDRLVLKKLPNYGTYWQLADRSLGHTIAGLGVLYGSGLSADDPKLVWLRSYFKHYLIARQLNDDAHDWEADMRQGHINAAGVLVLRHWIEGHTVVPSTINLAHELTKLQVIMWEEVIPTVCQQICHHVRMAARMAAHFPDAEALVTVLRPLEKAANKAQAARIEALDFITQL